MNTKLQELTDKIYLEGIEKGQEEAAKIIAQAEQQAAEIVANAEAQADKTLKSAEEKANELMQNTQVEIKLFAQQALNALKTEITDIVCGEVVTSNVQAAAVDKEFMKKILLIMTESLAKNQEVTIETQQAKELTDYFKSNAKNLLDKGVKIVAVNHIKTDFSIVAEKGGYKINFGEEEFIAYFKEFLRPQLVELLF